MIWPLRSFFAITAAVALVFFGFAYSAQAIVIPDPRTVVSEVVAPQGCEIIDLNWKEYRENIRGANQKVSDVVLNACEAIGGRDRCQFISGCRYNPGDENSNRSVCTPNTGAANSQHRQSRAIDIIVPNGKQKEFITFAICGLRKVNKCEGGVGLYKSGSIHVDVRTGTKAVWSTGYKYTDIATNVSDPEARKLLYSFGAGECTTGSIQGDYTEEEEYGPIEEYAPPEEFSDDFLEIINTSNSATPYVYKSAGKGISYANQLSQSLFTNPFASIFQGGGSVPQDTSSRIFVDDLEYVGPTGGSKTTNSNTGSSIFDFRTDTEKKNDDVLVYNSASSNAKENKDICEGKGFLGTNFFNTCNTSTLADDSSSASTNKETSVVSGFIRNIANPNGNTTNEDTYSGNFGVVNALKGTIYSDSSSSFYKTHIASDAVDGRMQTPTANTDGSNYGQFVTGGEQVVSVPSSNAAIKTIQFAEQSVLYGTYYGTVHGVSPLLPGSVPRSLMRLIEGNDFTRVHNLFSI